MRISFVQPVVRNGGGERVVTSYVRRLIERGHDVRIASVRATPPSFSTRTKMLLKGRPWRPAPVPSFYDFLGDRHIRVGPNRGVEADDLPEADILVATWWQTAQWIADFPSEKGRKCYFLQGYEVFDPTLEDQVAATYRQPMRKFAVSNWVRDTIREKHGVEDIALLPNAVDTALFSAPRRQRTPELTVGFMYTTLDVKNVALAIAAVERAKARLPGLRVKAFGDIAPSERKPLPDWVEYHCKPDQSDIPGIYAACDLWLFTSHAEGFGLPILEAMACRTPVLATRAGASPDLIDGRNGRLLSKDATAFADAIIAFAEADEAIWQQASDAAHQSVQAYDWEKATDRLERLFEAELALKAAEKSGSFQQ